MLYGYIRVSTQTQAEKGFGKDTQYEKIVGYEKTANEPIERIFYDLGISGTEVNRDGLNELLDTLKKGDKVVVANTSRLWRSDTVKVIVHHQLKKIGADIISIEQPSYSLYAVNPEDFLLNSILEVLDQYDRMLINRRLAAGRTTKAKRGLKPCGAAPYGYKWERKEIVIDEEAAKVVRDVYWMSKTGKSEQHITDCLNLAGIPSATGGKWHKTTIHRMLTNPFYKGFVVHKGHVIPGNHLPIISD